MSQDESIFMLEMRRRPGDEPGWTREAYDDIYHTHGIRQLDSFYLWLLDLLDLKPGGRLLDVSCGQGVLTKFALEQGVQPYGLDISWVAIRQASLEARVNYVVGDGERLPYADGSFDYVTNNGSLEHFENMSTGIREMARILKPEGKALVLLPNTYSLFGNILSAINRGVTVDDGQPIQRYAALNEWRQLLQANGLHVMRVVKYEREWPRSWQDAKWYLGHPKPLIRLLLTPFIPRSLAWCLVYICKPA